MSDKLELKFCDLCGISIPLKDIEEGVAREVSGKLVGACCLAKLLEGLDVAKKKGKPLAARSPVSTPGLFVGIVLLLALLSVTYYLDSQASKRNKAQSDVWGDAQGRIGALETSMEELKEVLAKYPADPMRIQLARLQTSIEDWERKLGTLRSGDGSSEKIARDYSNQLADVRSKIEEEISRDTAGDRQLLDSLSRVEGLLAKIDKNITELGAREASPEINEGGSASDAATPPTPPPTLPEELARHVKLLGNDDPSERWAAVDELLRSGDKRVVPYLLPMLKDPDPFVRRLCATGLGNLGDNKACPALVDALEDDQAIVRQAAYRSLVKLSEKTFPFDAEATAERRKRYVKRWREWLKTGK